MKIVWSDPAVDDLAAIRDFISQDSGAAARTFLAQLLNAVDRLERFPESGRKVPELPEAADAREVLHHGYRLIYRAEEHRVVILAVIHGARRLAELSSRPWEH